MPAIPPHTTTTDNSTPWDANAQVGKIKPDASEATLRKMYAWVSADGDPTTKAAYKFPHHQVSDNGTPGAANLAGVRNALARLPGSNIPNGDIAGVQAHLRRHLNDGGGTSSMTEEGFMPRDNLARALYPGGTTVRDLADGQPVLEGYFSVFNEWTEIASFWEGNFMERVAPGAFAKTITENKDGMRVLFQHGRDPQIGDKPLGPIDVLEEKKRGPWYEVPMLDTSYNRDIVPGLRAGLYGASFRFKVMREEVVEEPEASSYNPKGLPERTIKEAQVMEFGPVTFPAYPGASAGVRSITDVLMDVDAIAAATPILLDEERLGRARAFISRPIPTPAATPTTDPPTRAAGDPDDHPPEDVPDAPVTEPAPTPARAASAPLYGPQHPGRVRRDTVPLIGQEEAPWRL